MPQPQEQTDKRETADMFAILNPRGFLPGALYSVISASDTRMSFVCALKSCLVIQFVCYSLFADTKTAVTGSRTQVEITTHER